jgi:Domain of unknown function (DUF4340)
MKIRGLIIASSVFFVLAGLLYWSDHHKSAEGANKVSADTPPVILKLDQASITGLEIKKKDAEPIVLAKPGSGDWRITAPTALGADQSAVSSVLTTLSLLNSQRLVEDKAEDLKPFGLSQPALQVALTDKNNKTRTLLIGDDTPTGGGAYAKLAGDPRIFTVDTYAKTSVDKGVNDLRDKRLLTADPGQVSRVELVRKGQTIEFGRTKDGWQIVEPKPLRADSSEVDELVRKLTEAKMDLSGTNADTSTSAFAHAAPVATARVTDPSGTQELQVRKDKNDYYAKSSVVAGIYRTDSDAGQAMDKGLEDFRNKKLFDFGFNDPTNIELHVQPKEGAKAYFLMRNGTDWWSNGKKMDADEVQTLVSRLRDLTASQFVASGFGEPSIEAKVTSNDGKRVEDVVMAKSGADYVAKRENESALYQVSASVVDELQKAADAIKPAAAPGK